MRRWNREETERLASVYQTSTNEMLAEMFPHKTQLAIYKKAYKMGLRKPAEIEFKNRSNAKSGERAGNWKGGRTKTRRGYILVQSPEHHRADKSGYVMEHILVYERETGTKVPPGYCVHHLNGIKDDNRIENLCMMGHAEHTAFHHTGAKRSAETRKKISDKRLENERKKNNYE